MLPRLHKKDKMAKVSEDRSVEDCKNEVPQGSINVKLTFKVILSSFNFWFSEDKRTVPIEGRP